MPEPNSKTVAIDGQKLSTKPAYSAPGPTNATVTIDGRIFHAKSAYVALTTSPGDSGTPMVGSTRCSIECIVDMRDNVNLPYPVLKNLFDLANIMTRDKVRDMKIEFWQDETHQNLLCTYVFKGWIKNFVTGSGENPNHTLSLSLQPTLDSTNCLDLQMESKDFLLLA